MILTGKSSAARTEQTQRFERARQALRIATRELDAMGDYDDPDLWEAQMHVLGATSAIAIALGKRAR
jgi:hypothetical protein